jgi:mono/diheme cytochrome c family protein
MRAALTGSAILVLCAVMLLSCATEVGGEGSSRHSSHRHAGPVGESGDARAGEHIYKQSCAACHGTDARGTGPVAPLLKVDVPDLTRIQARRGGQFPELEVFRIIDGQSELAAHGPRHMPIWGYEFFGSDADDELAHRRATEKVDRLVAYLASIQR